jgi:tRNA threonylcarbamoyladenosine biosynthesis protein TsaE
VITIRTDSADVTRKAAAAIAGHVRTGDVLLLAGDLGAGKTTFTQGFGAALGITDPITSPTFTLLNEYRGSLRVLHADVYRLDSLQEVIDLGIDELVEEDAVALVEWGESAAPAFSNDHLSVRIEFGEGDDDRIITLVPSGRSWGARLDAMAASLTPWTTT